jgi:hypothetical protein
MIYKITFNNIVGVSYIKIKSYESNRLEEGAKVRSFLPYTLYILYIIYRSIHQIFVNR